MRILQTELIQEDIYKKTKEEEKQQQLNHEKMSRWEIEELMGVKRPTYKRNKGAFRQK